MSPGDPDPPEFDQPEAEPATSLLETVDAASEASVRKQIKRQAERQRTAAEVWQAFLSTVEGRREAWAILANAGTFENRGGISANGSYDPAVTALHQGQRSFGQYLFSQWLGYDRENVLRMLEENDERAKEAAKAAKSRRNPNRKSRPST